jgi:hypothetical protein
MYSVNMTSYSKRWIWYITLGYDIRDLFTIQKSTIFKNGFGLTMIFLL